ncbi:MAG: SIMPL domain-containing protein [Spirochaetota bacterium]|nr:SIMPL domain-containing protein [Spirochaetota bacterium]
MNKKYSDMIVSGAILSIGLIILGYLISSSIVRIKEMDRTVIVKGLSEREAPANIAIWPIKFSEAGSDLNKVISAVQLKNNHIIKFLKKNNFDENEITISAPSIIDRHVQEYFDSTKVKFRYSARSTITVYTDKVGKVIESMKKLVELGKRGIAISSQDYQRRTEFIFSNLNDIKPKMIEEATKNARQVALKFAKDSNSKLGKIKHARQGQFSIYNRDSNTPHIKKIRVVSTIEYYLSD